MIDILKILFLLLAILYGVSIGIKLIPKNVTIPDLQVILFSIGVTGFIYLQWLK